MARPGELSCLPSVPYLIIMPQSGGFKGARAGPIAMSPLALRLTDSDYNAGMGIRNSITSLAAFLTLSFCLIGHTCLAVQSAESAREPRTTYHFRLSEKGPELTFQVALDKDLVPESISVFRADESRPFQILQNRCKSSPGDYPNWDYPALELLRAADMEFDGYNDIELVAYGNMPHLENLFYCVWLWDPGTQRFHESSGWTDVADPKPDPMTRTIHSHRYYLGGPEIEQTYAWLEGKLTLIEVDSLFYDGPVPGCGLYTVEKRVTGELKEVQSETVDPGKHGFPLENRIPCSRTKPPDQK